MAVTKYKVSDKASLGLFLRSEPVPKKEANKLAVLPMGQEVIKLADAEAAGWWNVSTTIDGTVVTGFVSSKFLTPVADFTPPPAIKGIKAVHLFSDQKVARSNERYPYALNEQGQPTRDGAASTADKAKQLIQIIKWLDVENKIRYSPKVHTYCNIYAYDYCYLAGIFLPRVWWNSKALLDLKAGKSVTPVYGKTVDEINANSLFGWLKDFGPTFGWKRTFDLDEMQNAANSGQVVIICAPNKIPNKSGHICPVVPETAAQKAIRAGGKVTRPLQSQAGRNNHQYQTDAWWIRLSSTFREHGFWINAS
jgi:hypothetical protein